jgi:glutathione S-transferase
MSSAQLIVGKRSIDPWSMAAWLAVQASGLQADELALDSSRADDRRLLERYAPSLELPVLIAGDVKLWECISIIEFVAELAPAIWPTDPWQRARARSVACEIRNRFSAMRQFLPMDCLTTFERPARLLRSVQADLLRIRAIVENCMATERNGEFLFGEYSAADMMMAPIACSLQTHQIRYPEPAESYFQTVLAHEAVQRWITVARSENAQDGANHAVREVEIDELKGSSTPELSPVRLSDNNPDFFLFDNRRQSEPPKPAESDEAEMSSEGLMADEPVVTPHPVQSETDYRQASTGESLREESTNEKHDPAAETSSPRRQQGPFVKPIGDGIHRRR